MLDTDEMKEASFVDYDNYSTYTHLDKCAIIDLRRL